MNNKRFDLRFYLYSVLVIGILSLLGSILSLLGVNVPTYVSLLFGAVFFVFFWYNLTMLFYFIYRSYEKITLVLPIFHIAISIIFPVVSIIIFFKWVSLDNGLLLMIILNILIAAFEIFFSVLLLSRFGFFKNIVKDNVAAKDKK